MKIFLASFLTTCVLIAAIIVVSHRPASLELPITYTNTLNGYEISYPEDFVLREFPDDYPSQDISRIESFKLGSPMGERSQTTLYLLRGKEYLGGEIDKVSISSFAKSVFDAQVSCQEGDRNSGRKIGSLERVSFVGGETYRFVFSKIFNQKLSDYCGGFTVGDKDHYVYALENKKGVKFLLIIPKDDPVAAVIGESLSFSHSPTN